MMTTCSRCKKEFTGRKHHYCKACHAAYMREFRKQYGEKYDERHRARALINRRVQRRSMPTPDRYKCCYCGVAHAREWYHELGYKGWRAGFVVPACFECHRCKTS
jgi:hypothetical protein